MRHSLGIRLAHSLLLAVMLAGPLYAEGDRALPQAGSAVLVSPTGRSVATRTPQRPVIRIAAAIDFAIQDDPRIPDQRAISEELDAFELDIKPVSQLSTRITPEEGELPRSYAATRFLREGEEIHRMGYSRATLETQVTWEAPADCHRPLYFEEVNLERHGQMVPLIQPALSAAHFFGRVPLLPYLLVSEGCSNCEYTLGHYRPGDFAPYSLYLPRVRFDATAAELATAAGLILVIP